MRLPIRRSLMAVGGVALTGAVIVAVPTRAGATFGGPSYTNGFVAFDGNCNSGNQQVLDINPSTVGATPPACSGYGQQTTVGTDANPFYSKDTSTVYFASNRNGNWAIFSIPSNFGGTAADGATQLTAPGTSNDFSPAVTADGKTLSFVRCNASNTCSLETMNLGTSVVTTETTDNPLTPVSNLTTGEHDRPEFNPANGSEVLYECSITVSSQQYGHICLHIVGHPTPDVDLSGQAHGVSPWPYTDENPDFKFDGSAIIFDTSGDTVLYPPGAGTNVIYKMSFDATTSAASAANRIWVSAPGQGHEIDPIFSPDGTQYVWAHFTSGTYIFDAGPSFGSPKQISPSGKSISSQPTWEGAVSTSVPEAPRALLALLPGSALLIGGLALGRRRRRAHAR